MAGCHRVRGAGWCLWSWAAEFKTGSKRFSWKGAWASADRRTLDQGGRLLQKLKARFVIAERDILLYSGRFGCSCKAPGKQGFLEFFAPACEEISGYERAASGDYWAFGARRVETAD